MEASGTEVSKEQREASEAFGRLLHRAAVRSGGKSVIAGRAGVDRDVIKLVTTGYAFSQDRVALEKLVDVIRFGELGESDLVILQGLIPSIKGDS